LPHGYSPVVRMRVEGIYAVEEAVPSSDGVSRRVSRPNFGVSFSSSSSRGFA